MSSGGEAPSPMDVDDNIAANDEGEAMNESILDVTFETAATNAANGEGRQEEGEEEVIDDLELDCYPYTFSPLLLFAESSYFDRGYSNYNSVAQFFSSVLRSEDGDQDINMLQNVLYDRKNMLYEDLLNHVIDNEMLVTCCIDAHFTAFKMFKQGSGSGSGSGSGDDDDDDDGDDGDAAARTVANSSIRATGDGRVLYGPFGDLIFTESTDCGNGGDQRPSSAVYILREAVNIKAVPASKSREAHSWKSIPQEVAEEREAVELLYNGMDVVTDIALGPGGEELFVSGLVGDVSRIVRIPLNQEDDDDDDSSDDNEQEDEEKEKQNAKPTSAFTGKLDFKAKPFYDVPARPGDQHAGATALTLDNEGNVYATYPGRLVVIDEKGNNVGSISLNGAEVPTAVEIGDDGYLYVSTASSLLRVRVRVGPAKIGTDMVIPPKKESRSNVA